MQKWIPDTGRYTYFSLRLKLACGSGISYIEIMKKIKSLPFVISNGFFALFFILVPLFVSKGKYPVLTAVTVLIGSLFAAAAVLLLLGHARAVLVNRLAALTALAAGCVLVVLLFMAGTYVRGIFGALGTVISGTLMMAVLATANLFFIYPGIVLYRFSRP